MANYKKKALEYHEKPRPGKIEIKITKPTKTVEDLSLAYTPGVAEPVLEIAKDKNKVYLYTNKDNLVAVITNGTAILGLGNKGALASKPVMEGKSVLFKRFADVDAYDIEVDTQDVEEFIKVVENIAPTFGGINLEDIKAPECFAIEEALIEKLDIPVFHDDQHGTAIIASAGLINALKITEKRIENIKVIFNGAGAAAIAIAKLLVVLGVRKENIIMVDSKGVIYEGRTENMHKYKQEFASKTDFRTLKEAIVNADVFVGVSVKDALTPDMVKTMSDKPIVFAMANPDPEIDYNLAKQARADIIMATGRSDFPNQVNNVLGFPFIFRGALDVRASQITENMKIAAVYALAGLAREEVPEEIKKLYNKPDLKFGPDYIVPTPFDSRVIEWVAPAVAKAAIEDKVAQKEITDWDKYKSALVARIDSK